MVWENLLGIIGSIGEYAIAPIGRQFGYLICYKRNVKKLQTEVENLRAERAGKQQLVDTAEQNAEVILLDVMRWLTLVDAINQDATTILEGEATVNKGCLKGWCPNPMGRYMLSRKAKNKTTDIVKLIADGKQIRKVSCPPPPPGIKSTITENFMSFESRQGKMKEAMDALKNDNINMIGICGMGGIGKTAMVKELGSRAVDEKLFDKVVMAVVTQNPNDNKIQDEIAVMLGLKFFHESATQRANLLQTVLKCTDKILVILDDVWAKLELQDIGIPFGKGHKGCKIMFTSRNQGVWNEIHTKIDIPLQELKREEAWILFKETVGNSVDTPDMRSIAQEVVTKCGCLPLALVTTGRTLINQSIYEWKDTLRQLKMPCPIRDGHLPAVNTEMYWSVQLTYNKLDEEAKSWFLLCCLFPAGFDIPIEILLRYGVGLLFFKGINVLEQARNRVHVLVKKLKDCFLLLDGYQESVRLHDVIRGVAIAIASEDEHGFMIKYDANLKELQEEIICKRCATISVVSEENNKLPQGFDCPVLELLIFTGVSSPDNLFEAMNNLKVLELRDMSIPSLPSSLALLKNLKTLRLSGCSLEKIAIIGELEKLEILSFSDSLIQELPKEIGQLKNLKLFDLENCTSLRKISPGVMSGLSQLEELYMRNSFEQWEVDGKEASNLSLAELDSLPHLNVLEIHVLDPNLLSKTLFPENLERYKISLGGDRDALSVMNHSEKNLALSFVACTPLVGGIYILLKRATSLYINLKGLKNAPHVDLVREASTHLRHLRLLDFDTPKCLADSMDLVRRGAFSILVSLYLHKLPDLKEICCRQVPPGSFGCLRCIDVDNCDAMRNLFSQSMATGLRQLETLQVYGCNMMEEIISNKREEDQVTNRIEIPRLKQLIIGLLPSLSGFCKEVDEIAFPQLELLRLSSLPMLKNLCPMMNSQASEDGNDTAIFHSLINPKVKLAGLKELRLFDMKRMTEIWCGELQASSFYELILVEVFGCEKLLEVFPSNLIHGLLNLERLDIRHCRTLKVVFDFEELKAHQGHQVVILPHLEKLKLKDLPMLTHVLKKVPRLVEGEGFYNLKSLKVESCGCLKNLLPISIVKLVVKLQQLRIKDCEMLEEILTNDQESGESKEVKGAGVLDALPNLNRFCPGNCCKVGKEFISVQVEGEKKEATEIIELLSVRYLRLDDLPSLMSFYLNMKAFSSASLGTQVPDTVIVGFKETMQHHLFNKQVAFPSLEILELRQLHKINEIWCRQLPNGLFRKLRVLKVHQCDKLLIVAPSHLLKKFPVLEEVKVSKCTSVEEVFEFKEQDSEGNSPTSSGIRALTLLSLPRLMHLCKNDCQGILFENLVSLSVVSCKTLRNIFSHSMAKALVHLQKLKIIDCMMMEVVVAKEGNEEDKGAERINEILFSQLNCLELKNLPSLRSFCHVTYALEWLLLKKLVVYGCLMLQTFSLGSLSTPKLKGVKVRGSYRLVWMGDLNSTIQHLYKGKEAAQDEDGIVKMDSSDDDDDDDDFDDSKSSL